jgi:hypothetical protein
LAGSDGCFSFNGVDDIALWFYGGVLRMDAKNTKKKEKSTGKTFALCSLKRLCDVCH